MSGWIKSTDKTPEADTPNCSVDCLFTDGQFIRVGYMYLNELAGEDPSWYDEGRQRNVSGVTHWMPLPEAPQ